LPESAGDCKGSKYLLYHKKSLGKKAKKAGKVNTWRFPKNSQCFLEKSKLCGWPPLHRRSAGSAAPALLATNGTQESSDYE